MAQRKLQQMEKLRGAFGLSTDVNEGDAFNPEVQEAKRVAEREKRDADKKVCGQFGPMPSPRPRHLALVSCEQLRIHII